MSAPDYNPGDRVTSTWHGTVIRSIPVDEGTRYVYVVRLDNDANGRVVTCGSLEIWAADDPWNLPGGPDA